MRESEASISFKWWGKRLRSYSGGHSQVQAIALRCFEMRSEQYMPNLSKFNHASISIVCMARVPNCRDKDVGHIANIKKMESFSPYAISCNDGS